MRSTKIRLMLKYQKATSKLVEYSTKLDDYPNFPLDYRELSYPTIYILSEYSNAIIFNDDVKLKELYKKLKLCCDYYDAALSSKEDVNHSFDFLLSAAISYFFNDNYGSSKVLVDKYNYNEVINDSRMDLLETFNLIFYGNKKTNKCSGILDKIIFFLQNDNIEDFEKYVENNILEIQDSNYIDCFYYQALFAVVKKSLMNSAMKLLPKYSNLNFEKWQEYFKMKKSIKTLWPAQKLICEKGILKGKNGIIQLPTGVGKTRSIDLIIRSCFLGDRGKLAIIIAPLRALCNEISLEMSTLFPNVKVNLISDLFENDYEDFFEDNEQSIIVCTPEKMQYILRHNFELLKKMSLIVLDESHLFDDKSRGADYELLVSNIKSNITSDQQLVLMSAVLSNVENIAKWAFNENAFVAYDENIKSTNKGFAFVSIDSNMYYFSNSLDAVDFYIPNTFEKNKLERKPRERKDKFFPEENSYDYALFYANKLVKNGGVAVFVPQRRSIQKIMERFKDLYNRNYDFSNIINNSDEKELRRFANYFEKVYGTNHIYTSASSKGVLLHHRYLSTGIKSAIEYAFKNSYCKIICCTSTLAQGVNIPIKYLLVTSLKNMDEFIPVRNFQNLIGRTARSGTYTEGSIIVTDPKYYDDFFCQGRNYKWPNVVKMFDFKSTEPCSSAILDLLREQKVLYSGGFKGKPIIEYICNNLDNENWDKIVYAKLIESLKKHDVYNSLTEYKVSQIVTSYHKTIGSLESEVCSMLSKLSDEERQNEFEFVEKLLKNLLAYSLANDEEKLQLMELFKTIYNKIKKLNVNYAKIGKSMGDINLGLYLERIIIENNLNEVEYSEVELLNIIIDCYTNLYNDDISVELCEDWINTKDLNYLKNKYNILENRIEEICYGNLSYEVSFLISNIIDSLDDNSLNLSVLNELKSKIKYGVNSNTKILLSECLFDDRIIVNLIDSLLSDEIDNSYSLKSILIDNKEMIISLLNEYPSYFLYRFNRFINE